MRANLLGLAIAAIASSGAPAMAKQQREIPDTALAGPSPSGYDAKIRGWLESNLKDPDSAQIKEVRGPRVGAHEVDRGFLGRFYAEPAWWVCYKVNAKNSYGGYTGYHTYMFGFRNGILVGAAESPQSGGVYGRDFPVAEVEDECALPLESKFGTPYIPGVTNSVP